MKYVDRVREIAEKEAASLNLSIESVEWVFENNVYILRIIADKEEGLDINDATNLNTKISDALDKDEFIEEEYMLEVSSPGVERELKNDFDIKKSINEYVHIDFIEKVSITKNQYIENIEGYLTDIIEEENVIKTLIVEINIKGRIKKLEIEKQNIKFIRKAIKF